MLLPEGTAYASGFYTNRCKQPRKPIRGGLVILTDTAIIPRTHVAHRDARWSTARAWLCREVRGGSAVFAEHSPDSNQILGTGSSVGEPPTQCSRSSPSASSCWRC